MISFLFVLVIFLIGLSVWNLLTLYNLKKYNRSEQKIKNDRYYELKYKTDYITTVVVVMGIGAFFGYNWFEEIKDQAADNLREKTASFDGQYESLNRKLKNSDTLASTYTDKLNNLFTDYDNISKKLNKLFKDYETISEKQIIKYDFYIVDNLKFPIEFNHDTAYRFYYKNLKSITGDKLPEFKKPPVLFIVPENNVVYDIREIHKEYVELSFSSTVGGIDTARFNFFFTTKGKY